MSSLDLINRPWQAWKLEGTTLVPGELDSLNKLRTRELHVCKAGGSALGERYRRAAPRCAKVQPWNNCSQAWKGLFLSLLQTNPWQVTGSGSCPQTNCWMRSRSGWPSAYWRQRALCEAPVAFGWKESEPKEGCSYGPEWRLLEVVLLSILVTLPLSMLPPPLGGHKDFVRQARSVTYKMLPLLAKSWDRIRAALTLSGCAALPPDLSTIKSMAVATEMLAMLQEKMEVLIHTGMHGCFYYFP